MLTLSWNSQFATLGFLDGLDVLVIESYYSFSAQQNGNDLLYLRIDLAR